jgi:hypothetical protein
MMLNEPHASLSLNVNLLRFLEAMHWPESQYWDGVLYSGIHTEVFSIYEQVRPLALRRAEPPLEFSRISKSRGGKQKRVKFLDVLVGQPHLITKPGFE